MLLRCHEVCLHNMSLLHTFATILLWCWVCVVSDCASLYQPSKPWIRDIWSHVDGDQRLSWWCVGTVMPTIELANNDNPWSKDLKSRTASLKVLLTCFDTFMIWGIYDLRLLKLRALGIFIRSFGASKFTDSLWTFGVSALYHRRLDPYFDRHFGFRKVYQVQSGL